MAATKPRPQPETREEQPAPNYDSVRKAALNLPMAAQTRLVYDLLNRLAPEEAQAKTNRAGIINGLNAEQQTLEGNILDIVGRWDFAYDIEDDELKQILGEARLEKYAPGLLPEMRAQWESDRLTHKRLDEQARLARKMGLLEEEEKEE